MSAIYSSFFIKPTHGAEHLSIWYWRQGLTLFLKNEYEILDTPLVADPDPLLWEDASGKYIDKLKAVKKKTKLNSSVQVAHGKINNKLSKIIVHKKVLSAIDSTHAIAVLTEWQEFELFNWELFFNNVIKPAFIFDGRNILNLEKLNLIGYKVYSIGK